MGKRQESKRLDEREAVIDPAVRDPMHTQVRTHILHLIGQRGLRAGQKLPSIRRLSDLTGVGRGTIARAVAQMTDEGIFVSQPCKGVYLADADPAGRPAPLRTIYCLSGAREGLNTASEYVGHSPFWAQVLRSVRRSVLGCDPAIRLRIAFLGAFLKEDDATPRRRNWREIGLLILGDPAPGELSRIVGLGASAVQIHGISRSPNVPSVRIDSAAGIEALVDHLASLGHRRICYCGLGNRHRRSGPDDSGRPMTQEYEKYKGFARAMTRRGLPFDPETSCCECFLGLEEGYQAAQTVLKCSDRPTAIIAINDETAIGAMRAVADAGLRIPRDISVAAFDNIDASRYAIPSLTTVDSRMDELGQLAVASLLALHDQGTYQDRVLKPDVIVRESTAAIRE
ncbi:MAG: substrate-binding domain-containing protein [Phycisphaerae bacterium]|nr:substrate-binding domain-containing protein [Phycisphaerae bacterium]